MQSPPLAGRRFAASGDDGARTRLASWSPDGTPTILLFPAANGAATDRRVEIRAVFGPFQRILVDEIWIAGESVSLDMQSALGIHGSQVDYLTQIEARVSVIIDGQRGVSDKLGTRYLAIEEATRALALLDDTAKRERYPHGVTSAAARERIAPVLAEQDPADGISLGFEPDVAIETPIGTRIRPSDD